MLGNLRPELVVNRVDEAIGDEDTLFGVVTLAEQPSKLCAGDCLLAAGPEHVGFDVLETLLQPHRATPAMERGEQSELRKVAPDGRKTTANEQSLFAPHRFGQNHLFDTPSMSVGSRTRVRDGWNSAHYRRGLRHPHNAICHGVFAAYFSAATFLANTSAPVPPVGEIRPCARASASAPVRSLTPSLR